MPLFLFISGRFTKKQNLKQSLIKISLLLETYIVFQLFNHFNLDIVECRPVSLWFRMPATVSWYLLTLIYYRLLIAFIPERFLLRKKIIIPVLFVVSLLAGFFPLSYDFSVQRSLVYMVFFYMGYSTKDVDFKKIFMWLRSWICVVLIISFYLLFYLYNIDISKISSCARTYYQITDLNYFVTLLVRVFVLLSAVILSICFMKVTSYIKALPLLSKIGKTTLLIYIYHIFFAKIYQHFVSIFELPNGVFACIVYSLITLIIVMLMSKLTFFSWILNPISQTHTFLKLNK